MDSRYTSYATLLRQLFSGERMQKISINAGFTCPNRDGSKGVGGCTFCNNQTFVPEYCLPTKSVSVQMKEGIDFFKNKYTTQRYLAYFQSYTNTYAPIEKLKKLYEEALNYDCVEGLIVGTRPDCVTDELLDYFAQLTKEKYVMVEYGVESLSDDTLRLINRGHMAEDSRRAIVATAERGIAVGAHLILGLPKESRQRILQTATQLNELPIAALKLHQLQLIRGTVMEKQYAEHPEWFHFFSADEYVEMVVDFLEYLSPKIAVERFVSQSPKELLIAPKWGLKNFEFTAKVEKRLRERDTYQGKKL